MGVSMDPISNYYNLMTDSTSSSNRADSATSSISGISADSSEEEMREAVESFEAYMVEQVIKQVRETMSSDDEDEDSTISQYKDMYMDSTIASIAKELVSEYGGSLTDDLVTQMKRNYGIE